MPLPLGSEGAGAVNIDVPMILRWATEKTLTTNKQRDNSRTLPSILKNRFKTFIEKFTADAEF